MRAKSSRKKKKKNRLDIVLITSFYYTTDYFFNYAKTRNKWNTLCDLVPSAQFKKREKWRVLVLVKLQASSWNYKLCKWYNFAQCLKWSSAILECFPNMLVCMPAITVLYIFGRIRAPQSTFFITQFLRKNLNFRYENCQFSSLVCCLFPAAVRPTMLWHYFLKKHKKNSWIWEVTSL